jgi:general stress protein 26
MQIQERDSSVEGFRQSQEEVNAWLREQVLCAFATLDETGAPNLATVAFTVTGAGELLIGTAEDSRKSRNVSYDNRVAVVVTDSERRITVQLEGTARTLAKEDFDESYAEEHYRQRPESLPFRDESGQTHILVTPTHLKFSDCRPHPWVITEFKS